MCRRALWIVGLLVLLANAGNGHAGPPVVMQDGSGAGRLNGLMLLLAIENLKRRPAAASLADEQADIVKPEIGKRLMGIAEMHRSIVPTAGEPRRR